MTSQLSLAANYNAVHWDDLNWEKNYDGAKAYSSSKIALGLFALELQRRSDAGSGGIRSNLSHPGISPTNLLAAQPHMGRKEDTTSVRVIRFLSRHGILLGTPQSASLPALLAATSPERRADTYTDLADRSTSADPLPNRRCTAGSRPSPTRNGSGKSRSGSSSQRRDRLDVRSSPSNGRVRVKRRRSAGNVIRCQRQRL